MADLEALAGQLSAMIDGLQQHIEARATEIAEPQIRFEAERNEEAIRTVQAEAHIDAQRRADLEHELRRQLNALVATTERQQRELKETRAAIRRVEELKVWTNEDGKRFVFADELWEALAESGSPAARAYAELRRRQPGATDAKA